MLNRNEQILNIKLKICKFNINKINKIQNNINKINITIDIYKNL